MANNINRRNISGNDTYAFLALTNLIIDRKLVEMMETRTCHNKLTAFTTSLTPRLTLLAFDAGVNRVSAKAMPQKINFGSVTSFDELQNLLR